MRRKSEALPIRLPSSHSCPALMLSNNHAMEDLNVPRSLGSTFDPWKRGVSEEVFVSLWYVDEQRSRVFRMISY